MKAGFLKSDWFFGLAVVVVVLVMSGSDLRQSLERKAYDMGVMATSRAPLDRVAVIAIDDTSLRNIGRWPWSREVHARLAGLLAGAQAKVIANLVYFSEPQIDAGYGYITKLIEIARSSGGDHARFMTVLEEAEQALNTDRTLAQSYASAGNVVLPLLFQLGQPLGRPDKPMPDYVQKSRVVSVQGGEYTPLPTQSVEVPVDSIGRAAAGLGHLNVNPDVDGGTRSEPLVLQYFDQYYPSLSMMVAAKSLNLTPADIRVRLGEGVQLGRLRIDTDPYLQMYTYFYKDRDDKPAFRIDSFYDVLTGKIKAENYRDKIVLIGPTAAGIGSTSVTPISPAMAPVLTMAHSVSSILQEHFFVSPTWVRIVEKVVVLAVALYLILLLPRLSAGLAAGVTGGVLVLLLATHFGLMMTRATWMQLMLPATLLLIGHVALVTKRFIVTERAKLRSDENSAESNRMLGLAYQGQGQLDLAWDKFRQVPLSEGLLDNLYNLALDYERKRQFNKAESVFRYMFDFKPDFRDLEQRMSRAKQLSETVMLGGAAAAGRTNVSILGEGGEKPMLGRYAVEKELGKGAMGVVYLGKDPKIGRVVAIKTMALSQEFEADELDEVKERFFREAETAGRLSHPNIVTIYDAGEEHDLCYIAMELLKGGDLVPFTKPGALLPVDKVVSIIARAADALGYAHTQNVVHRDIKPANMMYHLDSDTLKLADFGIARLTDSSKTKTGMVLGTPSYMSPEQLAGKKVDGRSDLFSLAGTLYQLLCGKLPFEGDSMAQLMFRIANEDPPDVRTINPDVPETLVAFLNRAMLKDPDQRFQTGQEFAEALRAAYAGVAPTAAPPAAARPAAPRPAPAPTAAGDAESTMILSAGVAQMPDGEKTMILPPTAPKPQAPLPARPAAPAGAAGVLAQRPAAAAPRPVPAGQRPATPAAGGAARPAAPAQPPRPAAAPQAPRPAVPGQAARPAAPAGARPAAAAAPRPAGAPAAARPAAPGQGQAARPATPGGASPGVARPAQPRPPGAVPARPAAPAPAVRPAGVQPVAGARPAAPRPVAAPVQPGSIPAAPAVRPKEGE